MKGLHLANGYSTNMTLHPTAGDKFTWYATYPYGVRVAWYKQAFETQPDLEDNVARIFGHVDNKNDFLWGYGSAHSDPADWSSTSAPYYTFWDYETYGN